MLTAVLPSLSCHVPQCTLVVATIIATPAAFVHG